ncbi:hypothetical protein BDW74DRAFT_89960 [Aspergillus multicolor]|uniref:uncharacterized protein n=1 Tax=Aspergillus multicolor TaxID=41759 RepID=UPI003CCCD745
MSSSEAEFPSIDDLKQAVESGQRITAENVSVIGQLERELTGSTGPMQETAQALVTGQMDFDAKLDELAVKTRSHITMRDTQEIEEMEVNRREEQSARSSPSLDRCAGSFCDQGRCEGGLACGGDDLRGTESERWNGGSNAERRG